MNDDDHLVVPERKPMTTARKIRNSVRLSRILETRQSKEAIEAVEKIITILDTGSVIRKTETIPSFGFTLAPKRIWTWEFADGSVYEITRETGE